MHVNQERQVNPVTDEVLELTAVVRPILRGALYSLKTDVVRDQGGYENVTFRMLPRLSRSGDGDYGICFEYAVWSAPFEVDRTGDLI